MPPTANARRLGAGRVLAWLARIGRRIIIVCFPHQRGSAPFRPPPRHVGAEAPAPSSQYTQKKRQGDNRPGVFLCHPLLIVHFQKKEDTP